MYARFNGLFSLALLAAPIAASIRGIVPVTEPREALLFVLAVTGVVVGHHFSRGGPHRDD